MTEAGRIICIYGTDTDAGKTVLTAALLRACLNLGLKAQAVKPVQTGCLPVVTGANKLAERPAELLAPDVLVYKQAASQAGALALHCFREACSPHLAACLAGQKLEAASIAEELRKISTNADITLVEAAGGLLAPLNEEECMADLAARLRAPALLAVPNRLGAVNHALLSLEAMRARGIEIAGFIMCDPSTEIGSAAVHEDNPKIIAKMGGVPCLAELPHQSALAGTGQGAQVDRNRERAWKELAGLLEPALKVLLRAHDPSAPPALLFEAEKLLEYDRAHLWHPYTSALTSLKTWLALGTQGSRIRLRDSAGEVEVVDGMSSWWAAIHGYNHPRLLEALRRQAAVMPHVMFGGITHQPALALAEKLLELAPANLGHVFLADSGSVSVEVALKMAVQYQQACGHTEKNRVLTVCGGYHGDTLGAMSVCDPVNGMHGLFSAVLPRQIFAPRPECRFDRPYDPAASLPVERLFREEVSKKGGRIAALIIEPVVQGAGGMWFYHPRYLARLRELCTEHGALLILDEIATGFGRTGKLFASEWAGVEPDIMCVGKALTGGVMTLAATLASPEVARGISSAGGVLMHGPTFMGNPLACAVAGTSLDLLAASPWRERVARIEFLLKEGLASCRDMEGVGDVRVLGAIGVVEMKQPVNVERLQEFFVRQCGVWLRPFGRLIYLMPPYVTAEADLRKLAAAVVRAVEARIWE